MKTQLSKFTLAAGIGLALAFTFSCSGGDDGNPDSGTTLPPGGGKGNDIANYKTVPIGSQTWMAENLNYAVEGGKCYGEGGQVLIEEQENDIYITLPEAEIKANCEKYGRLYDWETAKIVCPNGWHLPTKDEWDILTTYVESANGCRDCNAKYLKATSYNGEDKYEFSALSGGGVGFGNLYSVVFSGWWSASEGDDENEDERGFACSLGMDAYSSDGSGGPGSSNSKDISRMDDAEDEYYHWECDLDKSVLLSVRCVKD